MAEEKRFLFVHTGHGSQSYFTERDLNNIGGVEGMAKAGWLPMEENIGSETPPEIKDLLEKKKVVQPAQDDPYNQSNPENAAEKSDEVEEKTEVPVEEKEKVRKFGKPGRKPNKK